MKPISQHAKSTILHLPLVVGFLLMSLVSGCGLAMNNEDRLDRSEQALMEGDFRAAIIDAKDVLLDEPDNLRGRLLLGRASVKIGNGPAAEKELRRAIELGADKADIAAELAQALLLQGKFDEVLTEMSLEGLPSSEVEARVLTARAHAHMGLEQPEAAREVFSSVLERQPDDLDARLGIVSSFVAEGNFTQARGGIDQILETNADNPRVWLFSGSFNSRIGDLETAEANYSAALKLASSQGAKSGRLQALGGLAEILIEKQDVDSARVHIAKLASEAPQSLQTKVLIARIAYLDKDWTTAQQNLQQILQVAPDYRPAQMLLGAVHLQSGNLSQAEMYLSAVVASLPDDVGARQMLAETRLQLRKADEAQEALAPIVSGPDADAMSLQMAARASIGRRDIDDALEYLRRSVNEDPGNVDLRLLFAATLLQAGRYDEAQAALDDVNVSGSEEDAYRRDALRALTAIRDGKKAVALQTAKQFTNDYSDRSGAFNLLGAVQLANGDLDGATSSFEHGINLDPANLVARQYLAAIDESNGELASAASRYREIVAEKPDAAWAMFALGKIAVRQKDYERAAENFRRASEAAPDNDDYRLNFAKAERQAGNGQRAAATLENEIERSLEHFPSAVMLGALKAESADLEGALDIARQLKERYPENPASFAFEAEMHVLGGNLVRADSEYEKALELGPVKSHALRAYQVKRQLGVTGAERPLVEFLETRPLDNEVRVVLAESYMATDNLSKSITAYEHVIAAEPANAVALNNLAWTYYLTDDPRALETARKANDAMPDNGAIVDTLGWIMIQQGSVEEGEQLLRKAIELENGRAEIRYHHTVALEKLGRIEEARSTLEQLLASDDEFTSREDAEKLLAEL